MAKILPTQNSRTALQSQVVAEWDILHPQKVPVSENLSALHLHSVQFYKAFLKTSLLFVQINTAPQVQNSWQYLQGGVFSSPATPSL